MGHGNQKSGVLVLVFAFGLMLLGAAMAADQAAPAQPTVESKVTLKPFGLQGPACDPNEYAPVPNDKKQTVLISIDPNTIPPSIKFDSPKCVQESVKGSLTFNVEMLPTDYWLEIDFVTRPVVGKPHKGPFKSKKPRSKYPVAGRCVMSKSPKDSCVFDKHDMSIPTGAPFQFTVFLWDEFGDLADEEDPGVMVVDNP